MFVAYLWDSSFAERIWPNFRVSRETIGYHLWRSPNITEANRTVTGTFAYSMFPRLSRIIVIRFTLSSHGTITTTSLFFCRLSNSECLRRRNDWFDQRNPTEARETWFVCSIRGRCKLRGFWYADKCKKLDDAWRMPRSIFARNSATKVYSGEFFFAVWRGSLRWNGRNALQPTYLTISSRFNVRWLKNAS